MAERVTPKGIVTPGEIVIMASGAVVFVFSFFPWWKAGMFEHSAWESGLFPIATLVPVGALLLAGHVVLDRLLKATLPKRVGDLTWEQVYVCVAIWVALICLGFAIQDRSFGLGGSGFDLGVGFYVDLLGSVGLLVGAFLIRQERTAAVAAASPPIGPAQTAASSPPVNPPSTGTSPADPQPGQPPPSPPPAWPEAPPPSSSH